MNHHLFIDPVDTLTPRGHRLFGAAGSFGEASMPPAPSVFAGALRSSLLCQDPARLAACEAGEAAAADDAFRLTHLSLARRTTSGVEALVPLPADLVAFDDGLRRIEPRPAPAGVQCPHSLPLLPVLRAPRGKPLGGCWLTEAGWQAHLAGRIPGPGQIVRSGNLWRSETRPGIALDSGTRTGADGALFSVEHVALFPGVGFLVGVKGADASFADEGQLRLAGDGRIARWRHTGWKPPAAPLDAIAQSRRFRLILASPGLFVEGWLPTGVDPATSRLAGTGFSARLACAAVPRAELVSGWDLLNNAPKPARLAAPAGSVYWFDEFEGDAGKLAEWIDHGLWPENAAEPNRRNEGWNRAWLAAWPAE